MASVSAQLKAALGDRGGAGAGSMYAGAGQAPAHVITGELWLLLFAELVMLGVIRFTFVHHLGG